MEIISQKEFDSIVVPLFNGGLTTVVQIGKHYYRFISQRFDYLKVISNYYFDDSSWYNIQPMELQQAIINASSHMGDDFIYLSFVGYSEVVDPNTPLNFKIPIDEFLTEEIYFLKMRAEKLIDQSFSKVLVYSPQGLWAALTGMDYYGTLGMTKDFLYLVRSIYPQLDEELDRQLFDFIRWYNDDPHIPDEWEYIPGDTQSCRGWCKGLMEYLCRIEISTDTKNSNNDIDLIQIYRNMTI
ncbi:hypothetical protein [Crocosphaera sp. Alani8]|uniref:hypothetical protein n=1 Tax=Crocosphaera sp. Alani8 TaxID=3038952 RepID=UPI00313EE183